MAVARGSFFRVTRRSVYVLLFGLGFSIFLLALALSFVHVAPPRAVVSTHMYVLKRKIIQYARLHDRLPTALQELPEEVQGMDDSSLDGQGNVIVYSSDANGIVRLAGDAPSKAGTVHLEATFPAKKVDGTWAFEEVDWIKPP